MEEAFPILGRGAIRPRDYISGDGSLGHGYAQLQQLSVDPGSAPEWIGQGHLPDQGDGGRRNGLSAHFSMSAFPFPEEAKSLPMPADDGVGSDELEDSPPPTPHELKEDPEATVQWSPLRSSGVSGQNQELVMQRRILQQQIAP